MHKNPLWLGLLVCVGLIAMWFSGSALYRIYEYTRLQAISQAISIQWSIKQVKSEEYFPYAHYTFRSSNGKEYTGESILTRERFRNAWVAEQELLKLEKEKWNIWYNPTWPHQSALQKSFPLKECLSAAALIILWGYFLGLGYYVSTYYPNKRAKL